MIAFANSQPMNGIADLRGQTLVMSNPQSLVAPHGLQWLTENGLPRDNNFKTIVTPTDDSVGNVIVRGDAVAAMLSEGEFRAIPEPLKTQIQILTTFTEVPGFVVMVSPRLAPPLAITVKEQLLQFATRSNEGKALLAATGFTGIHELPPGLMESMDAWVTPTRKVLALSS